MKANECICSNCRQVKTEGNFYIGVAGINTGKRLPICKDCCKTKLDRYTTVIGIDAAMWNLLAELNIPFIKNEWSTALTASKISATKTKKEVDPIGAYLKKLSETGSVYQGFWESDTMVTQLLKGRSQSQQQKDNTSDIELMRKKWGKYDDSNDAYIFLEETFNDYTEDIYDMDANLVNRYKDLCIAEYAKRKAQESGDTSEIAKAQDMIAKQLKLLKLDDFQQNKRSDEEKFVERMAWNIENTRPAECEDLEKYKDFSGIGKTWNDIMRCVQNLIAGTREYPDIPKEMMQ